MIDNLMDIEIHTQKNISEPPAHCYDLLYNKMLIYTTYAYADYNQENKINGNKNILKALETITLLQGIAGDIQETHFTHHMKPFYEIWKDQLTTACQEQDQELLILILNTMRDMQKAWVYLSQNRSSQYYPIKMMHA